MYTYVRTYKHTYKQREREQDEEKEDEEILQFSLYARHQTKKTRKVCTILNIKSITNIYTSSDILTQIKKKEEMN